jgi:hypothetical protein
MGLSFEWVHVHARPLALYLNILFFSCLCGARCVASIRNLSAVAVARPNNNADSFDFEMVTKRIGSNVESYNILDLVHCWKDIL